MRAYCSKTNQLAVPPHFIVCEMSYVKKLCKFALCASCVTQNLTRATEHRRKCLECVSRNQSRLKLSHSVRSSSFASLPPTLQTLVVLVCHILCQTYYYLVYIKKTNLMQSSSMFIGNCKIALHVSVAFCVHLQEH